MSEMSPEMRKKMAIEAGIKDLEDDPGHAAAASESEAKAQRMAEELAIDARKEHQEKIDSNRDQLMADLAKVYDQALAEVMMRDNLSTDTEAGAAFYRTAEEQRNRAIIELLDEAVAKNLDEKDTALMESRMKEMIGG
jgi:hypothetical protein